MIMTAKGPAFIRPLSGAEIPVAIKAIRFVLKKTLKRAAARANTDSVNIIGIIVLKESATAGGTPSPRLTFNLLTLESLIKSVVARRPMIMAPKRPLVPV